MLERKLKRSDAMVRNIVSPGRGVMREEGGLPFCLRGTILLMLPGGYERAEGRTNTTKAHFEPELPTFPAG